MILYPFFSVGHLYLGKITAGITVSSTALATSTISDSKKGFVILRPFYVSIVIFSWNYAGKFCKDDFRFRTASIMYGEKGSKFSGKFTKGCVITCMNSSDKEFKS